MPTEPARETGTPPEAEPLRFDDVVRRYHARVWRVALHLTSRPEDADDVCQEVFLYLFGHLSDFRGESALFTWIYRITRSAAFKILRKRGDAPPLEEDVHAAPEGAEPPVEAAEKREAIRKAFARLPENPRTVATLHLIEDLPLNEVARLLEAPEGTVRWWMFRAREILREALAQWAGAD